MTVFTPSSEDTRVYEICVLYPHPLGQKEEQALLKEIDAIFAEAKGKELLVDKWGSRGLAYTIGGYDEGNYVVYYYELDPSTLKEIDQALRILPGVLRHIMVKPPKDYEVVKYSEHYKQWQQDKVVAADEAEKQREEDLKQRIIKKQQTGAKRSQKKTEAAAEEAPAKPVDQKELDENIEKLIADDELEI